MDTTRTLRWLALPIALAWSVPAGGGTLPLFSSYLGGSVNDGGTAIAVDAAGNTYITGCTSSDDFPIRNAFQPPLLGRNNAFLMKLLRDGSLAWSTYLGGFGYDCAGSVAVDAEGFPWIGGTATAGPVDYGPDFPWRNPLPGSVMPQAGTQVGFIARFDPDGRLLLSTPFGDNAMVAADPRGGVWASGHTSSRDFLTTAGARDRTLDGPGDVFVARLLPGPVLAYSSLLGGSGDDEVFELETDASGGLVLSGWTTSPDFPLRRAAESQPHRDFAARLDPAGEIEWSTYLDPGAMGGYVTGLAADATGNAYVMAFSSSGELTGTPPGPAVWNPGNVVVKLDPRGQPVASVVIPQGVMPLEAIAVNPWKVVLSGYDYGLKLIQLETVTLQPVDSSTEEGGFPSDMALDARNIAHVTGVIDWDGLSTTAGAFQHTYGGPRWDGFVVRVLVNRIPDCSGAFVEPAILWPPDGKLVPVAVRGITDPDGEPVQVLVNSVTQDEPPGRPGRPDATGVGTAALQLRADRLGSGDGRVYHLYYDASDSLGEVCSGILTVCVPHDRHGTCGDGGEYSP